MIRQMVGTRLMNWGMKMQGKDLAPYTPVWGGGWGTGIPNTTHVSAQQAYEYSIFVAQALHKIMRTVSMGKGRVLEWKKDKYTEVAPDHPLSLLLAYPSTSELTSAELWSQTVGRLRLEGNCFWYFKGARKPESIEIIPSAYMFIDANQDNGRIKGYWYRPLHTGGSETYLQPEQIMHIKRWHPNNQYWGLSDLSSAMVEINGDFAMANWNQNFFGPRNAIPNMAIEFAGFMNETEFNQARQDWYNRGGMARETMFFRSGSGFVQTKIHDIGLTPMELSFLAGRQANKKSIHDLMGVPESLFDKDATEASSITGERHYYQMIYEELNALAERVSLELVPYYTSKRYALKVEFEDIRPVNEELKLRQIEVAAPYLAINEVRKRWYQMDEVEWGDGPSGGSGSAYLQFFGNTGMPGQGGPMQQATQNSNAPQSTDLPEGDTQGDSPQSRGLNKKNLIAAQRMALKAWDTGADMAQLALPLPLKVVQDVRPHLLKATDRRDVERTFDYLFEALQATEKRFADWTLVQMDKLPAEHRDLVLEGAGDIADAFGFRDRLEELRNVPEREWNDAQPPVEL